MALEFEQQLIITIVDKALIAGLLLLVAFGLNRALEHLKHDLGLDTTRRQLTSQSQIQFKEKQLAEFYGPVYALLKRIRQLDDLWNQGKVEEVDRAIVHLIRDSNNRIVEAILTKSHLIRGNTIPESYTRFLTHVAVWHAFWENPEADWSAYARTRGAHYDPQFEEEIFVTTEGLKQELQTLYQQYGIENGSEVRGRTVWPRRLTIFMGAAASVIKEVPKERVADKPSKWIASGLLTTRE